MGKRIIIGSMLVLVMLLLMPSIPAIQQKTIKDKSMSEFDINNLKENKIKVERIKHFLLYYILFYRLQKIWARSMVWQSLGRNMWTGEILSPIIYQWGLLVEYSAQIRNDFWQQLSNKLGWNWDMPL